MASRRAADELIASGGVRVNGKTPPPEGVLIDPTNDRITVHGKPVKPVTRYRYIVLNKPLGVITTARDEASRTTVLDVVGEEGKSGHRLFPVGRLDADTSGLLLLMDDGDSPGTKDFAYVALRKAQLAMLFGKTLDGRPRGLVKGAEKIEAGKAKRLPPFYWAAFVLSGDWR